MLRPKRKPGFPAKYVRFTMFVLPEDVTFIERVNEAQRLDNRNAAGRLVLAHARTQLSYLTSNDANLATEPTP